MWHVPCSHCVLACQTLNRIYKHGLSCVPWFGLPLYLPGLTRSEWNGILGSPLYMLTSSHSSLLSPIPWFMKIDCFPFSWLPENLWIMQNSFLFHRAFIHTDVSKRVIVTWVRCEFCSRVPRSVGCYVFSFWSKDGYSNSQAMSFPSSSSRLSLEFINI